MDIATLIGLILAAGLVIGSILTGPGVGFFFSLPSVMIVFGGSFGVTLINFPLKDVLAVSNVAKKTFFSSADPPQSIIEKLVEIAEKARREGILAIEREMDTIDDPYMKLGVQYAVDGVEPEAIRAILESELTGMEARHSQGKKIFEALGAFAPAFGMIGTLVGLIQMLSGLDDPSKIGIGMATALVTTLYGSMAANMVFLPMAGKLELRSGEEIRMKEMILEGILAIQSGDNPRVVRQKLTTFLPPADRVSEEEAKAAAAGKSE
ncbi:chemotaxis protein PomA [bacterium BMS3Bbin04]|nr:chemotaxis protein PomA [bacterium BMS3Bbin04]